jgi:hypothetical protein
MMPQQEASVSDSQLARCAKCWNVLLAGLCLVIITLAGAASIAMQARQSEIETWQGTVANLSTTLSEHIDQAMKAADLVLLSIQVQVQKADVDTDADLRRAMGSQNVFQGLRDKIAGVPQIDVAIIVAFNGDIINFSRSWPASPINVADRDYYKILHARPFLGVFLSLPVRSRSSGQWTFFLVRQIVARNGQPLGIVAVGIASEFFEDFFKAINPSGYATISLFRHDGILLARDPLGADHVGDSFADRSVFHSVLGSGISSGAIVVPGKPPPGWATGSMRIVAPRRLHD